MPNHSPTYPGYVPDEAASLGQKISDTAAQARDKVADLPNIAANKIDESRGAAAGGLHRAATALHESGGKVSDLAHAAAEKLNTTANYVRDHDVKGMMADVKAMVTNNPGPSLCAAAVVGFLVARAFSRDND